MNNPHATRSSSFNAGRPVKGEVFLSLIGPALLFLGVLVGMFAVYQLNDSSEVAPLLVRWLGLGLLFGLAPLLIGRVSLK